MFMILIHHLHGDSTSRQNFPLLLFHLNGLFHGLFFTSYYQSTSHGTFPSKHWRGNTFPFYLLPAWDINNHHQHIHQFGCILYISETNCRLGDSFTEQLCSVQLYHELWFAHQYQLPSRSHFDLSLCSLLCWFNDMQSKLEEQSPIFHLNILQPFGLNTWV